MSTEAQPPGAVRPGWGRRFFDALDERLGLRGLAYPVPEHANKLAYSLGGLSLIAFLLLLVTGIALAQFYDPEPATAHESVRRIITEVTLGGFLRGFHYWMAMAMVVLVGLHLLRVFVSGSFKRPREGNWIVGVVLAGITATFFFSGTVLKWDQESIEALEHNIEIGRLLGRFGYWLSPELGGIPLLHRLYTLHIAILPAVFFLVIAVHLLLVKRHGMAPSPFRTGPVPEPTEHFSRHLARLGGFALILIGIVTVLAVIAPPVHGPAPVEGIEVTKPPWPMLWLYPVENWVGVSGILWATLVIFAALLIVPFVDRGEERDPSKRLWVVIPAGIVVLAVLGLIVYALVTPVTTHIG
ncbi:MAG TPA: cytochrome b N-terminal domain-containing protein [Actinomycetota bacterium]